MPKRSGALISGRAIPPPIEEVEEQVLEVGACRSGPVGNDGSQACDPVMARRTFEQFDDLANRDGALRLCPADHAPQSLIRQHGSKVEEGACGRGDADAVANLDIALDPARAMNAHPRYTASTAADDRDLDEALLPAPEPPERRRREVAEDPRRAAGEYRSPKATTQRQSRVADRVDPAMQSVQASIADAPRDRAVIEPACSQGPERQDAVTLSRHASDPRIGW